MLFDLIRPGLKTVLDGQVTTDAAWEPFGVTDQFLADAETYHQNYFSDTYWPKETRRAVELTGVDPHSLKTVLDVGSGSGNTVFPALELAPNAVVVASDVSPQLLRILRRYAVERRLDVSRLETLCFDVHKDFFRPESFDLILGNAVLHHLLRPDVALANVLRWLKPNATAVFFEPFEYGFLFLSSIFQIIIDEARYKDAPPELISVLRGVRNDWEHRYGPGRMKPWTEALDDKWLFTKSYLDAVCEAEGCPPAELHPIHRPDEYARDAVLGYLYLCGHRNVEIPDWVSQILSEFDQGVSRGLKHRLFKEAITIFRKP